MIGCKCATCTSQDIRDKRNRASSLITFENGKNVLIDCGPEIRLNANRAKLTHIDYVIITHAHSDHINGIPDLVPLSKKQPIHIYLSNDAYKTTQEIFASLRTDGLIFHVISGPFEINGCIFIPIPIMHGLMNIFGYRFGDFAYITDCSKVPEESFELLTGVKTLVINALREMPHATHMSFSESLAVIERIGPRRAFWIHMNHSHTHSEMMQFIEKEKESNTGLAKIEIQPAVDGMTLDLVK